MSFSSGGLTGSVNFSGQESGTFQVSGNKLTGVCYPGNFTASTQVSGVQFKLPLSKLGLGSRAMGWQDAQLLGQHFDHDQPAAGLHLDFHQDELIRMAAGLCWLVNSRPATSG